MRDYPLMTDEQKDMVYLLRDFLKKEVIPNSAEYDRTGEYPIDIHNKLVEMGYNGIDIPEEYGGLGCDAVTTALLRIELGYADAGFASSFLSTTFGLKPVLIAGTEEQKEYYVNRLKNGKMSAMCITEPQSGSDMALTKTTAVRDGNDYIINGRKCFITNGGLADTYTVVAATDPSAGNRGMSLFIVEKERPGVSVGKAEDKVGIRASNTTDVVFEDVRVPAKNLIGDENKGGEILRSMLGKTRAGGMAPAIGIMQRAIELSMDYAKIRVTFKKPIGKHQIIQEKLANMIINMETSRSQLIYNCMLVDNGIFNATFGSITKRYVSNCAQQVTYDALQVYGGYGYSKEYPLEKLWRDARIYSIYEGTNEIQATIIANGYLGKF